MRTAEDIGSAIRAKRQAIGLTQVELAQLAGVGERFLSELERGKATAELGKVLRVCLRVGLDLTLSPRNHQ